MTTLETPRLHLRMFREEDFDSYADMMADPEVMRYLPQGGPLSGPEAWRNMAAVLGHWQLRGFGPWAVEDRASGQLVGRIGPFFPAGWPDLELIWAIRRQFWGQGFASEGARVALAYLFDQVECDCVVSLIRPQNTPSIRVAEKIGERFLRRMEFYGGEVLVYGICRQRSLKRREMSRDSEQGPITT